MLWFRTGMRSFFIARFLHNGPAANAEQGVFREDLVQEFSENISFQLWHPLRCRENDRRETSASYPFAKPKRFTAVLLVVVCCVLLFAVRSAARCCVLCTAVCSAHRLDRSQTAVRSARSRW